MDARLKGRKAHVIEGKMGGLESTWHPMGEWVDLIPPRHYKDLVLAK